MRSARQHRRQLTPFEQQRRRLHLDLVHERDRSDRGARPDRRRGPLEHDHRVTGRRAEVEDDVGVVEQPRSRRMRRLRRKRLRDRRHGDDRQASRLRTDRNLDRHRGQPAGAEDDHHVRRPELEVGEDRLGEPFDPLDEHRLALTVRADDLRVEGQRELHDRMEAGIGAVAREHLLDGDAGMAGSEEVDEPVRGDRVGTERRGPADGARSGFRAGRAGLWRPRGTA